MIAVIDYKKGNLMSVARGLETAGATVEVTDSPDTIARADALVLPGVGAFTDAMSTMNELGQTRAIRDAVGLGVPLLGICLGMHLLFEGGEEHASPEKTTHGLGFISGIVRRMPQTDSQGMLYKIPHVGWNSVELCESDNLLFAGLTDNEYFYFTHSYIVPESDATIGRTQHSICFPSAVQKGHVFGVQFHPEKSSDAGAKLLANFVEYVQHKECASSVKLSNSGIAE